jgi:hypothetical protein
MFRQALLLKLSPDRFDEAVEVEGFREERDRTRLARLPLALERLAGADHDHGLHP